MADGGSAKDAWLEVARGARRVLGAFPRVAKHIWRAGHDDQRLSWFAHYLICAAASAVAGISALVVGEFAFGHTPAAFAAWLFYMWREAGDERYHRDEEEDWDEEDKDEDWQGKPVEGVTPRFDKVGDLTGPTFNLLTSLAFLIAALLETGK